MTQTPRGWTQTTRPLVGRLALGVCLLLLLGLAPGQAAARPSPRPAPTPVAQVAVHGCPTSGRTVPNDYLGLSIEWSSVEHWFGRSRPTLVNAAVPLLQSMQSSSRTAGVLRIGGNSQDGYAFEPNGSLTRNTAFTGTINKGTVDALFEVARRSGWKVVLGVNLRNDDPAMAAALTRYAMTQDRDKRLLAVELGNEPNVYLGTNVEAYFERIARYVDALDADPVTRGVRLAGPALSNGVDPAFLTGMHSRYGARMPFTTWHHYANRPTTSQLLAPDVDRRWTERIREIARASKQTPMRMAEGNSVGGGGLDRTSNVLASTAWTTDMLLAGAHAGLPGVNLHSWDAQPYPMDRRKAFYTPFVVRDGRTSARPPYYALALLRDLPGKRFCGTSTRTLGRGHTVRSWTLIDPATQRLYVYIVHKTGQGAAGPVRVSVPAAYRRGAALSRITDRGGCGGMQTGIEGATLPADGRFRRPAKPLSIARGDSAYSVNLGTCQTALLEIAR